MSSISQRILSGIPVEVLKFAFINTTQLADVVALKVIIRCDCHLGSSPMCQLIHATTCDYYLFLLVIFLLYYLTTAP